MPLCQTSWLHTTPKIPDSDRAIIFVTRLIFFPEKMLTKYAGIQSFPTHASIVLVEVWLPAARHVCRNGLVCSSIGSSDPVITTSAIVTNWRSFLKIFQTVLIYSFISFPLCQHSRGGGSLSSMNEEAEHFFSLFFFFFSSPACVKCLSI